MSSAPSTWPDLYHDFPARHRATVRWLSPVVATQLSHTMHVSGQSCEAQRCCMKPQSRCETGDDCCGGLACVDGVCANLQANGATCTTSDQCSSGQCVDGVCCDRACDNGGASRCESCRTDGGVGSCTSICISGQFCAATGCAPKLAQGAACTSSLSCVSGFCADGVCCDSACAGGCETCSANGVCAAKLAGAEGDASCGPYLCRGGADGGTCPSECTNSTECSPTHVCTGSACLPKSANGAACTTANQCVSGNCVDGRCCNQPQSDCRDCFSCGVAGSEGTCAPVPVGQDPHNFCNFSQAQCHSANCNGAGICTPLAAGEVCAGSSCGDGGTCCDTGCVGQCASSVVTGSVCSGTAMSCPTQVACTDGYTCANRYVCRTTCTTHADCSQGYYCPASGGSCAARRSIDVTCSSLGPAIQCASGACFSGTCKQCAVASDCPPTAGDCGAGTCVQAGTAGRCMQNKLGDGLDAGVCTCSSSAACTNPEAPRCGTNARCTCGANDNACPPGTRCTNATSSGVCKFEKDWPCIQNSDCVSNICQADRTCS